MSTFSNRFAIHEKMLRNQLELIREKYRNSGNKGNHAEHEFRNFLKEHLPRRFDVGHGEVIDLDDGVAGALEGPGQIDVFVVDDRHPRLSSSDLPSTYFIEGVLSAGEVKTSLTSDHLKTALEKARAFKNLKPRRGHYDQVCCLESDIKRFVDRRGYFLFCFESQLTIDTIHLRIKEFEAENSLSDIDHLDGVFCLDRGALINLGDGSGSFKMTNKDGTITGWTTSKHGTLFTLISWLALTMPNILSFRSILEPYLFKT